MILSSVTAVIENKVVAELTLRFKSFELDQTPASEQFALVLQPSVARYCNNPKRRWGGQFYAFRAPAGLNETGEFGHMSRLDIVMMVGHELGDKVIDLFYLGEATKAAVGEAMRLATFGRRDGVAVNFKKTKQFEQPPVG